MALKLERLPVWCFSCSS